MAFKLRASALTPEAPMLQPAGSASAEAAIVRSDEGEATRAAAPWTLRDVKRLLDSNPSANAVAPLDLR
jgi:hypothetical protein